MKNSFVCHNRLKRHEFFILHLIKLYIAYNPCANLYVQVVDKPLAHHREVGAQRRIKDFHVKRLVAYELLACIFLDSLACHFAPRLNQTPLLQGRFQAVMPKALGEDICQSMHLTLEHHRPPSALSRRSQHKTACNQASFRQVCGQDARGWYRS